MTPKKPDWFEMTEGDSSSSGIRKVNKKLPLIALLAAGTIIAAGSIFASTNSEPIAVAETPTTSQSAAANQQNNSQSAPAPVGTSKSSSGLNSVPAPTVSKVPQRGENGEGREGREDGGREGEGHDD
jgi:hypothetical protein